LTLQVDFDYTPAERATFNYPGCGEEIEINAIFLGVSEISGLLSEDALEEIRDQIRKDMQREAEQAYSEWREAA
jgi:hypothetical protein